MTVVTTIPGSDRHADVEDRRGWKRAEFFTIELPLSRLTALAEEVALVLAQPVMDNWGSAELVRLTLRPSPS